jgi:hypothetical protein
MSEQQTCGQGLAQNAALPASLADLFGAVAEILEVHLTALDPTHKPSRPEFDAYVRLATEHREIESRLRALALQMEGYRDLPMAEHDMEVMTSPKTADAFHRLVAQEEAAAALLKSRLDLYRQMSSDPKKL